MSTTDSFVANAVPAASARFEPAGEDMPGSISWLRQSATPSIHAGTWRVLAGEWDNVDNEYDFPSDETFIVLEGRVVITLADGTRYDLGPGDSASFAEGTHSTWELTTPFRKFFVETSAPNAGRDT